MQTNNQLKIFKSGYGVLVSDKGTIYFWLRRHKIETKQAIRKKQIAKTYANEQWLRHQYINLRKTEEEIGQYCGVSARTISVWLIKFKITTRHGSEAILTGKEKYTNKEWLTKQRQELKRLPSDIAKECNVKEWTIIGWLSRYKISRDTPVQMEKKNKTYMNETWLYTKHWGEGKTLKQMGEECDSNHVTILNWMKRFKIPRNEPSAHQKPSGLEQRFMQFIEKHQLPFRYTGADDSEKINTSYKGIPWNHITPDYKHKKKKIAIETADKRDKERRSRRYCNSWQDWENKRMKAFNKAGWKALIVWEDEFSKNPNKILSEIKTLLG